jgi:hypothetical protein
MSANFNFARMTNKWLWLLFSMWATPAMSQGFLNHLPEGVYLSYGSLQQGRPELKPEELTNGPMRQIKVRNWFRGDSLMVTVTSGGLRRISPDSIYALVSDGDLYIQRKGLDHKVTLKGELLFFTESYPVRNLAMSPVVLDRNRNQTPRILDFKTGEILEYSVTTVESVFMERDPDLYKEFLSIESLKTKRQLLLRYIEKYNERHPVPSPKQL